VPILALPRRVAMSSRTRVASGSGRTIGEVPKVMATVSSLTWTSSTVSWLMVAIFWA
jgi:signal recognition particle GTPase